MQQEMNALQVLGIKQAQYIMSKNTTYICLLLKAYLFGITSPRLTRERIENRLYMSPKFHMKVDVTKIFKRP